MVQILFGTKLSMQSYLKIKYAGVIIIIETIADLREQIIFFILMSTVKPADHMILILCCSDKAFTSTSVRPLSLEMTPLCPITDLYLTASFFPRT